MLATRTPAYIRLSAVAWNSFEMEFQTLKQGNSDNSWQGQYYMTYYQL